MKFRPKTNIVIRVDDGIAHIDVSTKKYPDAVALVDSADVVIMLAGSGRWIASRLSATAASLYVRRNTPSGGYLLHRFLLGLTGRKPEVDHQNHNGLDNRRSNLRVATDGQNRANVPPRKDKRTSQYKGVYLHGKSQRWVAKVAGEWLGYHATEIDAARAYDRAATAKYGEFAYLNFPETCCGI